MERLLLLLLLIGCCCRGNLNGKHVFTVSVLIVGYVDDVMESMAGKDTLFMSVRHFDSVFGYGEESLV